ncbi:MAG: prepilin-type N-terminal cleavage/methylation domain-containing protein [Candidatus Thiodiazotropha sp. (ex Dulcina madagascariensis)]|nr:prepilin-type N-terminal cleavage/methylation domain-containing protein [Candidatus Thiodiazotropha sp. (ex Dulcina madagascariensis)]MCU7925521.1 prepilin-type N-terminal cleavage/methylation domain-containing protein [Candidatus Thiodiazotropha sp. (ex Dulcina madagascariensis)]
MKRKMELKQHGFTLVELLIVVIILALLAAIVVPQFASSTDDAKISSLDTTLANVRTALDLYYQQHGEYPSAIAATGGLACAAGTAGDGAIDTEVAFLQQLAYYTDEDGAACTNQNAGAFPYGPYIKKPELSDNPISGDDTLVVVTAGDLNLQPPANTVAGWRFDNVSGKFVADIRDPNTQDPDGNDYYTH